MKFKYEATNAKVFDEIAAYLGKESSSQAYSEEWFNYFNEGEKTPFARVNSETRCVELSDFADDRIVKTVEYKLETEIRGPD